MSAHYQLNHNSSPELKLNNDDVSKVTNNLLHNDDDNEVNETEPKVLVQEENIPREIVVLILVTAGIMFSFLTYKAYHAWHPSFFNPDGYLEPCNVTDAITIVELQEMKEKIASIEKEYNVLYHKPQQDLTPDDVKQAEKLSNIYVNMGEHYSTQREIRLKCYKENLYPKVCTEFTAVLGCHLFTEVYFTVLLFHYASKHGMLKRIIFFPTQGYNYVFFIAWGTCFFMEIFGYETCRVSEEYVKKFPL